MKSFMPVIKGLPLFEGIDEADLSALLGCLGAKTVSAKKDEVLLMAGSRPADVGIVLAGALHILREDFDGNRTLMATLEDGDIFAEALCCAGVAESPVTVQADRDSTVLLLPFDRIINGCQKACGFHSRLIGNMMRLIAQKNLYLQNRMEIMNLKSIRDKVLCYLEPFAAKQGRQITVPHSRDEMAAYLSVDRSALSHTLMRMKADGLISYHKNTFKLLL